MTPISFHDFGWKKEVSFIEDAASAALDVAATPVLAFLAAGTAEVDADDWKAVAKAELAVETGLVVAATEVGTGRLHGKAYGPCSKPFPSKQGYTMTP